jgi:hypothetical protein
MCSADHKELVGEMRNIYKVSLEVSEWEKPFGRSRRRWGDKIKTNIKEIGCEVVTQDRIQWRKVVITEINIGLP